MLAVMTFEDITGDGRLWAVRYEGHPDNILAMTFEKWNDHDWLRLYAIRFQRNSYLVTGGAIKLTRTMKEREHTLEELRKLENVRNFLLSEGAYDIDGFYDLIQNTR